MIREKKFAAELDVLNDVIGWIEEFLDEAECPMKYVMQITVAAEEIFVNIAHYAYKESEVNEGAVLRIEKDENGIALTFIDSGKPFNPLDKADPDTSLSAEERKIGGLGIYMVKKSMDDLEYKNEDGKNIFTIRKNY